MISFKKVLSIPVHSDKVTDNGRGDYDFENRTEVPTYAEEDRLHGYER
jgi:hypothetical protein